MQETELAAADTIVTFGDMVVRYQTEFMRDGHQEEMIDKVVRTVSIQQIHQTGIVKE